MKIFKKFALVLCGAACLATVTACSDADAGKCAILGKPSNYSPLSYYELSDDDKFNAFIDKTDGFASRFASAVYKSLENVDNLAVSPISVYAALSLAAECSDGGTRSEILSALGVSYDELRTNFSKLYRILCNEYKSETVKGDVVTSAFNLSNSIWVNSDTEVKKQCISSLSDNYFAYSYSADFANDNYSANRAVSEFVKQKTRGLIDRDFNLSPQTVFTLINTLYLKDIWNSDGDDLLLTDESYDFACSDGTKKPTKLLCGYYLGGRAYEGENFTSFHTNTEHGYSIKFILPKEGYKLADVFTAENLAEVNAVEDYNATDEQNKIRYSTRCLFPEFNADFDGRLNGVLQSEFGIRDLFSANCDFSNLYDGAAACESVMHTAKLKVDRKGIEGAAVTTIPLAGAPAPDEYVYEYRDFVVNRAFGYIVTDSSGVTLFSGVVNSVE